MNASLAAPLGRTLASVESGKGTASDCIPDPRMEEIARRLVVTLETEMLSDVVRSESEPQDKTKLWFRPSTGLLYSFNLSGNKWVEAQNLYEVCISSTMGNLLQKDDKGCLFVLISRSEENLLEIDEEGRLLLKNQNRVERFDETVTSNGSGQATLTVEFTEFKDAMASISLAWKEDPGVNARWWIDEQEEDNVILKFAGLANSTAFDVAVSVTQTNEEEAA